MIAQVLTPNTWIMFLPAVVATISSLAGVFLANRMNLDRELRTKAAEAKIRRRQRWEEFDEEATIAFQDKMIEFVQAIAKMNSDTVDVITGNLADKAANERFKISHVDVQISYYVVFNYLSRIHDREARRLGLSFFAAGAKVREEVEASLNKQDIQSNIESISKLNIVFMNSFTALSCYIGERIRGKIQSEREDGQAEEAADLVRQANSFSRNMIDFYKRLDAKVREVT